MFEAFKSKSFLTREWKARVKFIAGSVIGFSLFFSSGAAFSGIGDKYSYTHGVNFHQKRFYVVDHKQDIYVDFYVDVNGNGHFLARFSNGKRLDGDHFYAKVVLTDQNGQVVALGQHRVGVNATLGGKTKVRVENRGFRFDPEVLKRIANVRFEVGHFDTVDDGKFWRSSVKLGATIIGSWNGGFLVFPATSNVKDFTPITF